jgi:hypothetical protein
MVRQFLILIFCGLTFTSNSQSKNNATQKIKVNISAMNSKELFLDRLNIVGIQIVPDTKDSLTISVSQGSFSVFDKSSDNLFLVQAVKLGQLLLNVYKVVGDTKQLIAKKVFNVVLSEEQKTLNRLATKPNIALGNFNSGRIPIDTIKKLNCLTINDKYQLVSSTVYFSSSIGTSCTTTTAISSNCFDTSFRKYWERLSPGSIITFDRVEIMDIATKKKYIIPSISFVVVESKKE